MTQVECSAADTQVMNFDETRPYFYESAPLVSARRFTQPPEGAETLAQVVLRVYDERARATTTEVRSNGDSAMGDREES